MSKAKLIRDEIMGQFFAPKPNLPRIRTEEDVYKFALDHFGRELAAIPFSVVIRVGPAS